MSKGAVNLPDRRLPRNLGVVTSEKMSAAIGKSKRKLEIINRFQPET